MENMRAPRAKFERIYIISPLKVAIILLTSLHCFFLLISFLTSFWIETQSGNYGPLFRCEKHFNYVNLSMDTKCYSGGFIYDIHLLKIPLIVLLIIFSFSFSIISILLSSLSFIKQSTSIRNRYWLYTIFLLLFICLIDCFILVFIPLSSHYQIYEFRWGYGVHCGGTLFIFVSLISSILTHNTDDIEYIEEIEK
jgi:hypothetical protein